MKRFLQSLAIWFLLGGICSAQSYWWSQMLKKPDAKQSQEFFFLAGTNIGFTYASNRVIINSTGTNTSWATNSYYSSNSIYSSYATNWLGSNAFWLMLSTNPFNYATGTVGLTITQYYTDLLLGTTSNLFSNGLLIASGPYTAPSLIQPAGLGYLLQPFGGTLRLP